MNEKSNVLKKAGLIAIICTALLLGGLLVVATFFDFDITAAIARLSDGKYYSSNVFGRMFEVVGEDPTYIVPGIGVCFICMYAYKCSKGKARIVISAICAALAVFVYALVAYRTIGYICKMHDAESWKDGHKILVLAISGLFGIAATFSSLFAIRNVDGEKLFRLSVWAVAAICALAISQGAVHLVIKPLFGRLRYRAMYVLESNGVEGYSLFTPWYHANGKGVLTEEMISLGLGEEVFKSFPSGHTTGAAMIFTIASLPVFLGFEDKKYLKYRVVLFSVAAAYTIIVAVSRLIMGAHYLSDVVVGATITLISVLISEKVIKTLAIKKNLL